MTAITRSLASLSGLVISVASSVTLGQEDFDELEVLVEINATDGDIGFHVLLDGEAWEQVRIDDPNGRLIFQGMAKGALSDQGLTENFFESDEPVCAPGLAEEEDDRVVTLAEFQDRFDAGTYVFEGKAITNAMLTGSAELTYDLPAAPDIDSFDGTGNIATDDAVIEWSHGDDLGECPFDESITPPEEIEEVGWQVVVEPEDEEAVSPLRIFSVDLPPTPDDVVAVTVPQEFLDSYVAQGVTVFKFEVLALEESGNRTASEGIFCVATECPEEED